MTEPSTELERFQPRPQAVVPAALPTGAEIDSLVRLGRMLSSALTTSSDLLSVDKAVTKILLGRDLGLTPAQAMQLIHIFDGHVQMHYSGLLGFIRARDGYDYRIVENTVERCTIVATASDWRGMGFYQVAEKDEPVEAGVTWTASGNYDFRVTTTMQMADAEGWSKKRSGATKEMWQKMPRVMLLARAASTLVRQHMPEVCNGMPVYVDDEIEMIRARLSAGDGSGDAAGHELPQAVERLLLDARAVGYKPLSDRGVIELVVHGRDDSEVTAWLQQSRIELDAFIADRDARVAAAEQPAAEPETPPEGEEEVADAEVVTEAPDAPPAE
jgi:hypothetical protein